MKYPAAHIARPLLEWCFAAMVCAGLFAVALFFIKFGYLPSPFFYSKNQTFMDWYNPAFWAHHTGAYSIAHSFYPPLSFDFLHIMTRGSCYARSGISTRACDPSGYLVLSAFWLANFGLVFLSFRRLRRDVALPRALALNLSASMLYGWERGNLILPCFTAFILAYGGILRPPWLRAVFAGVAANFKPYLIVVPLSQLLRRDWTGVWRFAAACLGVYVASYILYGAGNPFELLGDAIQFMITPGDHRYGIFQFTTTYDSLLGLLASSAPLRHYLGPGMVAAARIGLPIAMSVGAAGASFCLIASAWRPGALMAERAAALALTLIFVFGSPGAYALIFLMFLVFLEPGRGPGSTLALIGAYLWCIPWDYNLAPIMRETNFSFLAGHPVGVELSLTLGALLRPGLVLMMQFGLVAASIADFAKIFPAFQMRIKRWCDVAT